MSLVRRFTANPAGRDFVLGDVHGCFAKLADCLDLIGFDRRVDRLFSVGDLVDRGPESALALEWLAEPWFFAVRGNHEAMAIDWAAGGLDERLYRCNGGAWNIANPRAVSERIAEVFRGLPVAIELETPDGLVGLVHADCPASDWSAFVEVLSSPAFDGNGLREAAIDAALWSRSRFDGFGEDVAGVRAVVVGHTPMQAPTSLGNVHYIDTGGWMGAGGSLRGFTFLDPVSLSTRVVRPSCPF